MTADHKRISLVDRPLDGATPQTAREFQNKINLYKVIFSHYFKTHEIRVEFTLSTREDHPYQLTLAINNHTKSEAEVVQAIADAAEFAELQVEKERANSMFFGFRKRPNSRQSEEE